MPSKTLRLQGIAPIDVDAWSDAIDEHITWASNSRLCRMVSGSHSPSHDDSNLTQQEALQKEIAELRRKLAEVQRHTGHTKTNINTIVADLSSSDKRHDVEILKYTLQRGQKMHSVQLLRRTAAKWLQGQLLRTLGVWRSAAQQHSAEMHTAKLLQRKSLGETTHLRQKLYDATTEVSSRSPLSVCDVCVCVCVVCDV